MVRKQTGRIFEGPRGGQWTAAKSKRPEVEQLNTTIKRSGKLKRKKVRYTTDKGKSKKIKPLKRK